MRTIAAVEELNNTVLRALYSQDNQLPLVIEMFKEQEFWVHELGCPTPPFEGLYECKLIKPAVASTATGSDRVEDIECTDCW